MTKTVPNKTLTTVVLDACTVYEFGGEWRSVFIRAGKTAIGKNKKTFAIMATRTDSVIDRVCADLVECHA